MVYLVLGYFWPHYKVIHAKSVGLVGNSHNSFSTTGGGAENFPSGCPLCFKFCRLPKVQSVPSACIKTKE